MFKGNQPRNIFIEAWTKLSESQTKAKQAMIIKHNEFIAYPSILIHWQYDTDGF